MSASSPLSRPWLLADIGGTNARFGWLAEGSEVPEHIETLPVADHDGPASAAQAYLKQLASTLGSAYTAPRAGAFAVASAVGADRVSFINSGWNFSRRETRQTLKLDELLLLNDFEAQALSLPRLSDAQLRRWPGGQALEGAAMAVIGPGTGLGVAGLMPTHRGYVAIAGEGGHATLAPTDAFEAALLAAAQREFEHVSAERLLSGIGLPVLHRAVGSVLGQPVEALETSAIVDRGLAGSDTVCVRTLDSFCALLGSFAGNVALTVGARGGFYIGGGIVPRLGDAFFASRFRERFEAKGRLQAYLQAIPVALITDTLAALSGAAQALEQHEA